MEVREVLHKDAIGTWKPRRPLRHPWTPYVKKSHFNRWNCLSSISPVEEDGLERLSDIQRSLGRKKEGVKDLFRAKNSKMVSFRAWKKKEAIFMSSLPKKGEQNKPPVIGQGRVESQKREISVARNWVVSCHIFQFFAYRNNHISK